MRAIVCILAGLAVFAGCTGAWWVYWPTWQVEARVKAKLPIRGATVSSVTYNKATGVGCGYVKTASAPSGRTHFVLMPDGSLKLDPDDRLRGSTLEQLEILKKHTDYLALVYTRCAHG